MSLIIGLKTAVLLDAEADVLWGELVEAARAKRARKKMPPDPGVG